MTKPSIPTPTIAILLCLFWMGMSLVLGYKLGRHLRDDHAREQESLIRHPLPEDCPVTFSDGKSWLAGSADGTHFPKESITK